MVDPRFLPGFVLVALVAAVAFVTLGVTTVTHVSMTLGARILLLPGATIFWPLIIARWRKARLNP